MKTLTRILLFIIFSAILLLLCRCSDDSDSPIPKCEEVNKLTPYNQGQIIDELRGTNLKELKQGCDTLYWIFVFENNKKGYTTNYIKNAMCRTHSGEWCK